MSAKEHAQACERGLGRIKQGGRGKLSRAQTFAFGQRQDPLEESPTAAGRQTFTSLTVGLDIAVDSREDPKRHSSRRMASY